MRDKIVNYIRAGYPGIYIVSHEEQRVEAEIKSVADALEYRLFAWSTTAGLVDTADGQARQANDPLDAIEAVEELPENSLVLLRDFHAFLEDGNPVLVRALKDSLARCKTLGKCLIILGCRQVLPAELERELCVIHFTLPDKPQLGVVLDGICQSAGLPIAAGDDRDRILDAATGLTSAEAENAYALAVIECRNVDPAVVAREKALTVKKKGLLEIVEVQETLDDIGGLDLLKNWLVQRREAFGERAREYRLPSPKGVLLLGVPGTGKSLCAKASASVLQRPLIKLDMGALMGSLVGESEANLRAAIHVAEAIAPCIVWIDELDKGLAGSKSSGASDGGTSARVFGSLISWMQERTAPVFIIATANDVTQLPPELLRKGRWDEIFWTDLPNLVERQAIWEIKVAQCGRDPKQYDLADLASVSDGYTGAEIEGVVADSLYRAFADNREPTTEDMQQSLRDTVPLSKLSDQVDALRKWSRGRARPATSPEPESKHRRIAA
ncbi:MAG: AAA family ATPase [Verrucomicrobia bacterium]|jgi:ATP-dependent 26S proteasome regulatory subunit|nr:AAA family ATPase [Verrucomicrobiota bacterium]